MFFANLSSKSRYILYLVALACIPQLARAFLGRTPILYIFYNINIALELLILFMFFRNSFSTKRRNTIFNITSLMCLAAGVTSILIFGMKGKFMTEWLCFNNLTYTTWILALMYDLYENDKELLQLKASFVCYVVGLFLYSSCTILIFALWGYIMSHTDTYLNNLWIIHDVFNTLMYVLFSIGFYLDRKFSHETRKLKLHGQL